VRAATAGGERHSGRPLTLQALHAHLGRITESLAAQLVHPRAAAPDWSATEWAIAPAVAAIHGVAALLARPLSSGPASWQQFLREQRAHTAQRLLRLQQLQGQLADDARARGIALVPLKGAALYALGLYAAGERPMADLDLLVRPEAVARGVALLERHGFVQSGRTEKHRVFDLPGAKRVAALGEHFGNPLKIELHTSLAEKLALTRLDLTEHVLPLHAPPGLNEYPSRAWLLLHVLAHAAGAMCMRETRLLHLEDIARLVRWLREEDWEQLRSGKAQPGGAGLWWAYPPLQLTQRYYGHVPQALLAEARAQCHWQLRRAAAVGTLSRCSISHLWITAFPSLAWARSARESLGYARERLFPSTETRAQRRHQAQLQPAVSGGAWAQRTQLARVWRFCVARQARQATLGPVRAALQAGAHQHTQECGLPAVTLR
jgi:Uncharacterised nucleotidyltransferase